MPYCFLSQLDILENLIAMTSKLNFTNTSSIDSSLKKFVNHLHWKGYYTGLNSVKN